MISQLVCTDDLGALLQHVDDGFGVIAGGTDVTAMYGAGLLPAASVVDLNRVPELQALEAEDAECRIGAAVRLHRVAELTQGCWAAVADGADLVGSTQTRNRATIGGNACRASPSGDTLPGLVVCDAVMVVRSLRGVRRIEAKDFFLGPGRSALEAGEILERIDLPRRSAVSAYHRATGRRAMDLATIGVAVCVDLDGDEATGGRAAIGGAAPRPLLVPGVADLVAGRRLADLPGVVDEIERRAQEVISPIDDARGSAWYRRRLVRPLLEQGLRRIVERFGG